MASTSAFFAVLEGAELDPVVPGTSTSPERPPQSWTAQQARSSPRRRPSRATVWALAGAGVSLDRRLGLGWPPRPWRLARALPSLPPVCCRRLRRLGGATVALLGGLRGRRLGGFHGRLLRERALGRFGDEIGGIAVRAAPVRPAFGGPAALFSTAFGAEARRRRDDCGSVPAPATRAWLRGNRGGGRRRWRRCYRRRRVRLARDARGGAGSNQFRRYGSEITTTMASTVSTSTALNQPAEKMLREANSSRSSSSRSSSRSGLTVSPPGEIRLKD